MYGAQRDGFFGTKIACAATSTLSRNDPILPTYPALLDEMGKADEEFKKLDERLPKAEKPEGV